MKALIMRADADQAFATARVLIEKGFQILCVESHKVAYALVRLDTIDLLVMDEVIAGQMTHSLALSGERRNPYLSTILLTDRIGPATDDLYELIPCLHALVGNDTPAQLLGQLAVASVSNRDAVAERVAHNEMLDAVEQESVDLTWDGPDMSVGTAVDDLPSYADVAAGTPELAESSSEDHVNIFSNVLAKSTDIDDNDPENLLADDLTTVPAFKAFERFDGAPSARVAQVSIIGEGRPAGVGLQ